MNSLALRINRSGSKNTRNSCGFIPLSAISFEDKTFVENNELFTKFLECSTVHGQLNILKFLLEDSILCAEHKTVKFLAHLFFYAEAKHPVKCFLIRHITKKPLIQDIFSNALSELIIESLTHENDYKLYAKTVSKLIMCIENFPAGVLSVRKTEMQLMDYLVLSLECCVSTLRQRSSVSPTEKNEIFGLCHTTLRLLLHIVQKTNEKTKIISKFKELRIILKDLLFDEDAPMDTKSVSGILLVTMHFLENGQDSWMDILDPLTKNEEIRHLLSNEASQLAVCSAVATIVAMDILQSTTIADQSAAVILTLRILGIGERTSSESTMVLGVTRTLVQISKGLDKILNKHSGLIVMDNLLVYIWAHLEHYMDSVRHLTAQCLSNVVKFCTRLKDEGDPSALTALLSALWSLDKSRKSFYVALNALGERLGARAVLGERGEGLVKEVLRQLNGQAVQACATTALETLLKSDAKESNTQTLYYTWIQPLLEVASSPTLDNGVLDILEALLAKTIALDGDVVGLIAWSTLDLRSQLLVSAAKGVRSDVDPEVLKRAAVHSSSETRILSLSLTVESTKTTETFRKQDLTFVLYYLKYNINAQSPNFRQLTLSMMKKCLKRLHDSYRVFKKQSTDDYYLDFLEKLRHLCFESLVAGANFGRRTSALQLLAWTDGVDFHGYSRIWTSDHVDKLLFHLEDSYESNKIFALEILQKCPEDMLLNNTFSISLKVEDILRQASSLKPTECVSAAYKLALVRTRMGGTVIGGKECATPEPVTHTLLTMILSQVRHQLSVCVQSVCAGATSPVYGLLHCARRLLDYVDFSAVSQSPAWSSLVTELMSCCTAGCARAEPVVANVSPEGHLPMDGTGLDLTDGRRVTAQMVLLFAWRVVKEASLLLGEICSRFHVSEESDQGQGNLTEFQLQETGDFFMSLLAETKHRGAFEQAYVGFTKLLERLWRSRRPSLHSLPLQWLRRLLGSLSGGGTSATRRSAGLPFIIQAIVTTEVQVESNPKCFQECMETLLRLAQTPSDVTETAIANGSVTEKEIEAVECGIEMAIEAESEQAAMSSTDAGIETRTHCANILRALYRHTALTDATAPAHGKGLRLALRGFGSGSWMERNSSTLLFSALMVRVFGVCRARAPGVLNARNRMTGRIFFLKYPELYDFMLNKLKEVRSAESSLRPALYPTLLLLSRLYPSALEGTVSNLKLVAFVPLVVQCGASAVLYTRELAARAILPLIAPDRYLSHLESMFELLSDRHIRRNFCHGILLQIVKLTDARPEFITIDKETTLRLQDTIEKSLWILKLIHGAMPCYLLIDEYLKMIDIVMQRLPTLLKTEMLSKIKTDLETLLFKIKPGIITSGREICLANALYLFISILNDTQSFDEICDAVIKSLKHKDYEVVLSTLNYLLILNRVFETDNQFQEHLSLKAEVNVLDKLRERPQFLEALCHVLESNKYLECTEKSLKVLTLEDDTEKYIVSKKNNANNEGNSNEIILKTLFECIQNEHEKVIHIYLENLSKFVSKLIKGSNLNADMILETLRVVFECSSSNNSEDTRSAVVGFLERNLPEVFRFDLQGLRDDEKFELKATLYATIIRVLEDDEEILRQRTADVITNLSRKRDDLSQNRDDHVISTKAAEILRNFIRGDEDREGLFCVIALLDFQSEVCITDDLGEECRVFDQNERYNIYLEETIWTNAWAEELIEISGKFGHSEKELVVKTIDNDIYRPTIDKLCNHNLVLLRKMVDGNFRVSDNIVNPKIKLFFDRFSIDSFITINKK